MACVLSTNIINEDGYGRTLFEGKYVRAHRLAYAEANGLDVLTMGGTVLHTCDTPACINPDHLVMGTQQDNMADKVAKGRQAKGTGLPQAKLTEAIVLDCRARYVDRCKVNGNRALAKEFGVGSAVMSRAVRGVTWQHLNPAQ
jgi:hypothetical protein